MEFKETFDNRFPRHLRLKYRNINNSKEFKENLAYLFEVNKINPLLLENKFLVKKVKIKIKGV